MSSMPERGLIEVAYFLSRIGVDNPPSQLKARTWKEAYAKFYGTFGASKTEEEFKNSLKNLRDHFDSHLKNNRTGWFEKDGETPWPLSSANHEVFLELSDYSDEELWSRIKPYATTSYDERFARKQNKKVTKEKAKYFSSEFSGRKGIPAREVGESVVNHGLIVDSLKLHIEETSNDALVYNTQKIDLAYEEKGILKRIYEAKTSTDTQSVYTAVGQLFMHSAGTQGVEKWIVLPSPLKNKELLNCLRILGINILLYTIDNANVNFA